MNKEKKVVEKRKSWIRRFVFMVPLVTSLITQKISCKEINKPNSKITVSIGTDTVVRTTHRVFSCDDRYDPSNPTIRITNNNFYPLTYKVWIKLATNPISSLLCFSRIGMRYVGGKSETTVIKEIEEYVNIPLEITRWCIVEQIKKNTRMDAFSLTLELAHPRDGISIQFLPTALLIDGKYSSFIIGIREIINIKINDRLSVFFNVSGEQISDEMFGVGVSYKNRYGEFELGYKPVRWPNKSGKLFEISPFSFTVSYILDGKVNFGVEKGK